ncbi:hypothetical protein HMPREF9412_0074 [Paenibacillus sp. HGF5]|nr:hypothetical protein HMPREF9412_0074 [Paenibacillus sp. HGF5]
MLGSSRNRAPFMATVSLFPVPVEVLFGLLKRLNTMMKGAGAKRAAP